MRKKVGEVQIDTDSWSPKRTIWGSVWQGKDDKLWGQIYFNIPKSIYKYISQGIYEYNEEVKEDNREYWIKTKTKEYKNYNTDPVIRCYIPRPCEDNMLSEALEELDGYVWMGSEGSIEIDITEKDFDEIIQSEVAKEL